MSTDKQDPLLMAHKQNDNHFRYLFEHVETSIWNEDLSAVYRAVDQLRLQGVSDLRQYLIDHLEIAWELAAKVRVIRVNQATLKLFEAKSHEDFLTQINKTFGPGAIDIFIQSLCAYWEKQAMFSAEANFRTFSGKEINAVISYQIPETAEEQNNIAVSILDITELKQAQHALQESEEKYRTLYYNAPLSYQSLNENGRFIDVNPAWLNTLGYERHEIIGTAFSDLLHPDCLPDFENYSNEFKCTGHIHEAQLKIKHKKGHYLDITFDGSIGYTDKGEYAQSYCVFQDITKRKQIEDELRKSEAHLRTLIETVPDLIWLKDPDGIYLTCNPKFERFFGATRDQIIGKTDYNFIDKALADSFREHDQAAMTADKPSINEAEICYADDNHHELLETIKTPMYDFDGNLIGVLGVGRDITERKQTEEALRRSQKMDAVGQLTGGIAHDFNNIINIILGNLELLKQQLGDNEKAHNHALNIEQSAQRAADLTRQLLSFSRSQAQQVKKTNISHSVQKMQNLISRSVTPQVEIEYRLAADLWQGEMDAGDFEDCLLNLILNARDAMQSHGQLLIETRNSTLDADYCAQNPTARPGDYVELIITDNGEGMSADQLEHIFEPFFTTKEQGKGTGLGLSMVYGFIQRSKGHIKVHSEAGAGTTFQLFLPRSASEIEQQTAAPPQAEMLATGNEKILVVDDEKALRELTRESLQSLGYRVKTACDGPQALKILAEEADFDLIISDVIMPGGLNGYELAEQACAIYPQLKVLMVSGYSLKTTAIRGQARFSDNLLSKPYTLKELAQHIQKILHHH